MKSYLDVDLDEERIKTLAKELEQSLNLQPDRALRIARKKLAYDAEKEQPAFKPAEFFSPQPQSQNSLLDSLLEGTGISFMPPRFDAPAIADPVSTIVEPLSPAQRKEAWPSVNTILDSILAGDTKEATEVKTMFQLQKEEGIYDRPKVEGPPKPQFITTPEDVRGKESIAALDYLTKMGTRAAKQIINKGLIEPVRQLYVGSGPGEFATAVRMLDSKEFNDYLNKPVKKNKDGVPILDIGQMMRDLDKIAKKEQQKVAERIPTFEVAEPETKPEKVLDFMSRTVGGIGGFLLRLWVMKKMIGGPPSVARDTIAWELENQAMGGTPGKGAAIKTGLGVIEKIPTVSKVGKGLKVGAGGGFYGGITLAQGGSVEEVVTNTLIGAGFQAWGIHKQNQFLKRLETQLKKSAYNQVQTNIQKGQKAVKAEYNKNLAKAKSITEPEARSQATSDATTIYKRGLKAVTKHHGGQLERQEGQITKVMDLMKRSVHHGEITEKLKMTPEELAKEIAAKGVTPRAAKEAAKIKAPPEKRLELAKKGYPAEVRPDKVRIVPVSRVARKAGAEAKAKAVIEKAVFEPAISKSAPTRPIVEPPAPLAERKAPPAKEIPQKEIAAPAEVERLVEEGPPVAAKEGIKTIQTSIGKIEIPESELNVKWDKALEVIFDYGNQTAAGKPIQPDLLRSLSMGDTVEYEGKKWLVMPRGWQDVSHLTQGQIDKLVGEAKIPLPPKAPTPAESAKVKVDIFDSPEAETMRQKAQKMAEKTDKRIGMYYGKDKKFHLFSTLNPPKGITHYESITPEIPAKKKAIETGAGAAAFGFASQNPAIERAQKLAAKNNQDYYVVQQIGGRFAAQSQKPKKGHYTVVKPSGETTFIKQGSLAAEESFDYGEHLKEKKVFTDKLEEFKYKLRQKNADVKVLQDELFRMVKASGMSPSKVKAVVGLLRNISPEKHPKTNVKNLLKAIARASEYTEEESRRVLKTAILKELKKAKAKKVHGVLKGKLTPETQRRLDFIRKNIKLERTEVLDRMSVNMERVQRGEMLPVEMLEANSLLNLTGIRGASSQELYDILEGIRLLRTQGKLVHDAKIAEIKERRDKIKERVLYILTGGKGLKEGASSLPSRMIEKKPSVINKLNRFSSAWDNILDYISRFDKSKPYESDISKLGDLVHISEHDEASGIEEYSAIVHNAFIEVFGTETIRQMWKKMHELQKRRVNLGTFINAIGEEINWNKFSKEEIIKKYMEMQDPTLEETFRGGKTEEGKTYGMHWTGEMRDAITNSLTEKERAWGDRHLEIYKEYRPGINEVYKDQFFVDMGDIFRYSPLNRMAEQEMPEEMLLFKEIIRHASTTNPSLKARVRSVIPLHWTEADKTLMNHIVRMEHFKAWAKTINELRSVFGDKKIRQAIRQYHGKHILKRIDMELDQFARGGIDQMLINNWIDRLRRNFTVAALARPAIAPKQLPSSLAYLTEMPLSDFVTGVSRFWLRPIKHIQQLKELSPIFKETLRGGYERDVKLAKQKGYGKTIARKRSFRDWLFVHIKMADAVARSSGQYAKWLSEMKRNKLDKETAMRAAEKTTGRTQPGWKLSQLSAPQKGGSIWKLFTMFQTQPIRYYNMAVDNARNAAYGRGSRLKALSNLALIWVILPMLFNWIADAFQWKPKHQTVAVALGPFAYIPIAGKLIKNIALAIVGEAYGTQLSPVQSIPERFKRAASSLRKLFKGERDSTKDTTVDDAIRVVEELAEGVGYAAGVPTPYLVQAERATRKAITQEPGKVGEGRIGWRKSAYAEFFFSPYALKAENRFEAMTNQELQDYIDDNTYDKTNRMKGWIKNAAHKGEKERVNRAKKELASR